MFSSLSFTYYNNIYPAEAYKAVKPFVLSYHLGFNIAKLIIGIASTPRFVVVFPSSIMTKE